MDIPIDPRIAALTSPLGRPEMTPRPSLERGLGQSPLPEGAKSFADTLKETIADINRLQNEADEAVDKLVTNERPDIHGTLVALEKADVSFRVMMEVRNKLVNAYQELMRMG
ncbi:MAG: flagellar hook-basal body protein FliE [candidate division BRC1 bacterium ADurb.BinA364]|nr:MAG: flagellar hook-basal body protein FliE [candidate division BRC1 bacterium ADurb.BinA364]